MNPLRSFYSDETEQFRSPMFVNPNENITVRLRCPKALESAPVLVSDTFEMTMEKESESSRFDYYACTFTVGDRRINYGFKAFYEGRMYYYVAGGMKDYFDWGETFSILPGFYIPSWAIGTVMYQIFTDRFYNGHKSNDVVPNEYYYAGKAVEQVFDWNAPVADLDVGRFYGGDISGIKRKLDYLQELGVEVIYLNPVFVSPSNHKYDCQDYDHVDPHLTVITKDVGDEGTYGNNRYVIRTTYEENLEASNKYFADFCDEVHKRGMRIILDGVFNHCGSFNKWMDKEGYYSSNTGSEAGAYNSKDSRYRNFFRFANPEDKNSYEGWWGFDTLPKLNYEDSEELCDYICKIGQKWVSEPYKVDGWRLDVAADLGHSSEFNHSFWKRFRKAVREANPEAVILAEHYGDAGPWLQGDEWDTIMNYDGFMEPLTWFLTGMEKHSDEFKEWMINNNEAFQGQMFRASRAFSHGSMYAAMNQLSNHDHSRFLTRTNHVAGRVQHLGPEAAEKNVDKAVFAEAVVFQMTWPGSPTIYYGDEAGLCGFTDPDNRRTYPWGREDQSLIELHRNLTAIRRSCPVLRKGGLLPIYSQNGVICFARYDKTSLVVTILNNNDCETEVPVDLEPLDMDFLRLVRMYATGRDGFSNETAFYYLDNYKVSIFMKPKSTMILKGFIE